MSLWHWSSLLIGPAALLLAIFNFRAFTYPDLVSEHRRRQWCRVDDDGWTLCWPLCWLYWFDLERIAPRFLRRSGVSR